MIDMKPLFKATLDVAAPLAVGAGPAGARSVSTIDAVTIQGERITATLAGPAADWMILSGSIGIVDVRMTVRTDDDAIIHFVYGGRLDLSDPAAGMVARVSGGFETGDERYGWLNRVHAVGKGRVSIQDGATQISYDFYEIG